MNTRPYAFAVALLATVHLTDSHAQTRTPGVNARQARQEARINRGVATGQLNAREAARLQGREAGLQAEKRAMKADGVVTPQERQDLRRTENRNSRAIHRQKHDGQVR
ncbi:hypothetical protein Q5H92_26575 [Hymenobacter sp. M29]|uniref:DUF4148 domain-containing protein n=1 Tax=Hymenobacter mellowenesis TaxID=3063995 RepID=A0ABT9AJA3_9BACT|nr:hypothetical protein [Hymenobacter sp. M29]MDO7849953.1 hypothetical protein [Hymenobacter sp. M29]